MPPPVRAVEIPKKGSGVRVLGVPTVADRVAQTVALLYLEPEVEPIFHPDSYGYRPRRSAHDALRVCRKRCWKYDCRHDIAARVRAQSSYDRTGSHHDPREIPRSVFVAADIGFGEEPPAGGACPPMTCSTTSIISATLNGLVR